MQSKSAPAARAETQAEARRRGLLGSGGGLIVGDVTQPLPPGQPGGAPGGATSKPLAGGNPPGATGATPLSSPATVSAPLFGGFSGGRPRKDGLRAGSPEALAADREKDRLRKARSAAAAKQSAAAANPAALPSAVVGAGPSPGGGVVTGPGLPPVDGGAVPWEAGTLKPLFDQLLPAVEALTVRQIVERADKAKLPGAVVKEIEKDAAWAEPSRKALQVAAPQVAAKWLNKSGVSAENQPELVLGTAVAAILVGQQATLRRLDKLILEANAPKEAPKAGPAP